MDLDVQHSGGSINSVSSWQERKISKTSPEQGAFHSGH